MAYIGLTTPIFALGNYTAATPTYTKGFICGKAMSTDIDPQYAEGSLYGDNSQAEYDNEFKHANITLGTTTLPIEAESVLYGHTVAEDSKEITDSAGDEAKKKWRDRKIFDTEAEAITWLKTKANISAL